MNLVNLVLYLYFLLPQQDLEQLRQTYQSAAVSRSSAEALLNQTQQLESHPLVTGYRGAAHMMLAKHVGNPFSKLSHFNRGKQDLAEAIAAEPRNIELRFLRFAVQSEAPGFLGYQDHLEEDKQMLLQQVHELQDEQLKEMLLDYLLKSEALSSAEKAALERQKQ